MQFKGDGLSSVQVFTNNDKPYTVDQRTEAFELPSQVNIGGAYDIYLSDTASKSHRITLAGAFIANAFGKDEARFGFEYAFKSMLMVRAGYGYEKGIGNDDDTQDNYRTSAQKGLSAGFTIELPLNKEKSDPFIKPKMRIKNPNKK